MFSRRPNHALHSYMLDNEICLFFRTSATRGILDILFFCATRKFSVCALSSWNESFLHRRYFFRLSEIAVQRDCFVSRWVAIFHCSSNSVFCHPDSATSRHEPFRVEYALKLYPHRRSDSPPDFFMRRQHPRPESLRRIAKISVGGMKVTHKIK